MHIIMRKLNEQNDARVNSKSSGDEKMGNPKPVFVNCYRHMNIPIQYNR